MNRNAAMTQPPVQDDKAALEARVRALELELEQKNVLLEQGFTAFTQAAEKLQESHKGLQQRVAELNLELDAKNKELERNLEEREQVKTYLSNIFESLPVGVLVTDLEGRITSANRTGLEMTGQAADALLGRSVDEVMGATLMPCNARKRPRGYELDEPVSYQRPDGRVLKLQVSVTPMTGEGETLGYIVNAQDVTLLKQLEEHAERRNRFTVMGEMAANMAHEIRNPLGSIELFASLVKRGLEEDEERLVLMNHISSGIASMNHIISNVLEYTKPRPLNLRKLNAHQLLREVGEFSRYMAEQNGVEVAYAMDGDGEGTLIRGDEDLLRQVFHNLMLNGVQSMTDGGTLTIAVATRTVTNAKQLARFGDAVPPGAEALDVVEVGLRDTGCGIPRDVLGKVFDPFFTTKSRGTGLGLAIVHNIVESHGATIDVESRENQGTLFTVTFPVAR